MKSSIGGIVASLALSAASSCSRSPPPVSAPTEVFSAPYVAAVSVDEAVMAITNARCDREVSCDNVGSHRVFVDRDACARELGHNVMQSLRPSRCPRGVDQVKLSTCLGVARNERCADLRDSVGRVIDCSPDELCVPAAN
jgi:hypothetical protein